MGVVSPYTLFYTNRRSGSGKTRKAKKEKKTGGGGSTGEYYIGDATGYLCSFDVGREKRKNFSWVNLLCVS